MRFSILLPDATINYIKNPALRYDTTGWNSFGSTITRSLDRARFGIASLKVVTNGGSLREGAYFRVSSLTGVSEPITVSAYVRGTGKVRIRLDNNVPGGTEFVSDSVTLTDTRWTRVSVTGFSTGGNEVNLYVETDEGAAKVRTFYVDGAQMERKTYTTTYCDGEQEGCRWDGLWHNSSSRRSAYTRAGGKWYVLSGPAREEEDLYMTLVGGMGMAAIENHSQSLALTTGFFSNSKVTERSVTLTFHAKHKVDESECVVTLQKLHQLRQLLINVLKPDRTKGDEAIWFEYLDGGIPLYFQARYDGGLEGSWDIRNQFVQSFPVKLLAVDPLLHEDTREAAQLDFQETLVINQFAGRQDGIWNNMNYGFNGDVRNITFGTRGEMYVCGAFTKANNNNNALNPMEFVNYIAYWDGSQWNRMGVGANSNINAIAVAPNGYVYVTGLFTSIGGVAANRVAYWDGSAWHALGTGLGSTGGCIAVSPNGDVYVGGAFTTAGGVNCYRIARWDGLQWRRLGQYGGLDNLVNAIVISKDGSTIYVGGLFVGEQGIGSGLNYVAKYNISTGLFSAMGNGFTNVNGIGVVDMKIAESGVVYAFGNFYASGTTPMGCAAYWNGSTWLSMGTGVTLESGVLGSLRTIVAGCITRDQKVYAFGNFTIMDGRNIKYLALWNGSTWVNVDAVSGGSPPGGVSPGDTGWVTVDPLTGDLYFGSEITSPATLLSSGITYITNPGTTENGPTIYILGPGNLRWIENQTTKKRLYIDLVVLSNEEVFIDFRKGTIVSTIRGQLHYSILPGSDFRDFTLVPGENKVACFMIDDVNAKMYIYHEPIHWSADATGVDYASV